MAPWTSGLATPEGVRDLSIVSPDPKLMPAVGTHLGPDLYRPAAYDDPAITPELGACGKAFFEADGIHGELSIVGSALDAMERILGVYCRAGDRVAVEDPMWASLTSLLGILGLDPVSVEIDDFGMKPAALEAALAGRRIGAVILTPRGQNPRGSALDARRSAELRAILDARPDVLVIEDDHLSLVSGTPLGSVASGRERWAVVRSMSKILGIDLRCTLISSDDYTAHRVQTRYLFGPAWVSHFIQRLVARLLSDPVSLSTIEKAGRTYTARREHLLRGLHDAGVPAFGRSGLSVLIPVADESEAASNLLVRGWKLLAGANYRRTSPPFLRVCTASLEETDADRLLGHIVDIVRPTVGFSNH